LTDAFAPALRPVHRLIPSCFPPIGLFDSVATAADLQAVMELVGWTNDRLVAERIARLPQNEWVYGISNASIVMASFLHVAIGGMRFNSSELGAWYASADIRTAVAEVGHHLRREAFARNKATLSRRYRTYIATLLGDYLDIRGQQATRPEVYSSHSYVASQKLGEEIRSSGGAGILYDSVRRPIGTNVVAHRPRNVTEITQTDHFEVTVSATSRVIEVHKLSL
jgi:RES domain-containing protein